ncbi:N-acetylmuramoyl-L-alanine amidase [Streptomyces sp. NPDC127106]|uniref:N-acetylmuramoyl-L-alanine amidase n=1 Tax=Streptomyces sp. NPDC127106 TaxID=3345360 RepID=UPI00363057E6
MSIIEADSPQGGKANVKPNRVRGTALAAALGVVAVLGIRATAGAGQAPAPRGTGPVTAYGSGAGAEGRAGSRLHRLALRARAAGEAVLARQDTQPFGLLGVSWTDPKAEVKGTIEARARDARTGTWSRWIELEPLEPGMDGPRPGARGATEPVWVGASDGTEVRVRGGGTLPAGLELNLVDPGGRGSGGGGARRNGTPDARPAAFPAPAPAAAATGAADPGPASTAPRPAVVPRAEWGADESLNGEGPGYLPGGKVKAVFVHHTADARPYDCTESAAIVRGIHVYHVQTNGWRDLGYNFLVDKCGTVFEGRKGGIDRPVLGAHTHGWNSESAGIAVLGDHTTTGIPQAAQAAIARIAAYKHGQYDGDMSGTAALTAGATQTNLLGASFSAGRTYAFPALSGHRDGFNTRCPGDALYGQLDAIRAAGPAARLKVAAVNGEAPRPGTVHRTSGPLSLEWTTSTPGDRLAQFELLVDGSPVATVPGTARTAETVLAPGSHRIEVRATAANGATSTALPVSVVAEGRPATSVPTAR